MIQKGLSSREQRALAPLWVRAELSTFMRLWRALSEESAVGFHKDP